MQKAIVIATETKKVDATKDTGAVRFGSGNIKFSDAAPAREATKDSGRVRMGSGNITF